MKNLADRVHAYAGTQIKNTNAVRVTYLKRALPRALDPALEQQLLDSIQMLGNISLEVSDFAKISFKEQINIIGNTVYDSFKNHKQGALLLKLAHRVKIVSDVKPLYITGLRSSPSRGPKLP